MYPEADAAGLFSFAGVSLTEGETIFSVRATDLAGRIYRGQVYAFDKTGKL